MVNAPRRCQLHITEVRRKRSGISATNTRELTRIIERVVGGEKERSQKSEVRSQKSEVRSQKRRD
jgi:hypothetical protein